MSEDLCVVITVAFCKDKNQLRIKQFCNRIYFLLSSIKKRKDALTIIKNGERINGDSNEMEVEIKVSEHVENCDLSREEEEVVVAQPKIVETEPKIAEIPLNLNHSKKDNNDNNNNVELFKTPQSKPLHKSAVFVDSIKPEIELSHEEEQIEKKLDELFVSYSKHTEKPTYLDFIFQINEYFVGDECDEAAQLLEKKKKFYILGFESKQEEEEEEEEEEKKRETHDLNSELTLTLPQKVAQQIELSHKYLQENLPFCPITYIESDSDLVVGKNSTCNEIDLNSAESNSKVMTSNKHSVVTKSRSRSTSKDDNNNNEKTNGNSSKTVPIYSSFQPPKNPTKASALLTQANFSKIQKFENENKISKHFSSKKPILQHSPPNYRQETSEIYYDIQSSLKQANSVTLSPQFNDHPMLLFEPNFKDEINKTQEPEVEGLKLVLKEQPEDLEEIH